MARSFQYKTKTAILLFAQSTTLASSTKVIARNPKQNFLLWKKMNNRVLKTTRKTKLPTFYFNETNQIGYTFGEKLANALLETFDKGFEHVIVIGNDCPLLKSVHLLEAASQLLRNDFVLGADFNGGAYLIGLKKSILNIEKFTAISWQTNLVFNELKSLSEENTIAILPSFNDCNTASDLKEIGLKLSYLDRLKHFILSLFRTISNINLSKIVFFSGKISSFHFNKGSPNCF
jgi:uncharacterized protein